METTTTKKSTIFWILAICILIITSMLGYVWHEKKTIPKVTPPTPAIMSFEDCARAGYVIFEIYPRQCKTPDGRTYAEEIKEIITYKNASTSSIIVDLPQPGSVTGKEFKVTGKAAGWYFEASFPVKIVDMDGKILSQGPAQALGDWMTSEFVPFSYTAKIPDNYIGKATVILMKDNPSGMPKNDASISFPITIEY